MQSFKQSKKLLYFSLKREKIKLLFWLTGCLSFVLIGIIAFVFIYDDPIDRQAMVGAMSNPAMEALFGKVIGIDNYTIGAMYSHTMTVMTLSLISISAILLVVRNTRLEEEEGMIEVFRALPTGKLAHTTSAMTLLAIYNIILAVLSTIILIAFGDNSMDVNGAVLTGVIYGLVGIFYGSVALLFSQLSSSSRNATMYSLLFLGLTYLMRIIGDTGIEWLSWMSPLGLLYRTKPFVTNDWMPVLLILIGTLLFISIAFVLQNYRDLGSGLLPSKAGSRSASKLLKTVPGLALNLLKTPLLIWTLSLIVLGVTYGSVMGDLETLIAGNEVIGKIIENNPDQNIVNQFIAIILGLLSIATVIPVVQILMKLYSEEKKGRSVYLLVGKHSRNYVLGVFVALSFLSSLLLQTAQVTTFALAVMTTQVKGVVFTDILLSGLAYLPALWTMIGLVVLLFGWLPRMIFSTWILLGFSFVILYFSNLFDIPEWVKEISPFYHVPDVLAGEMGFISLFVLLILGILFSFIGFIGFNKRDNII
ncbi:ABC transporter permease [Marinilactibacillus psychrotolerans]|uniref:ABC transporter permease n=1 Tax=Marinilactibacillus psychrotolerans TaxID=191770 RepID=UPI00388A3950